MGYDKDAEKTAKTFRTVDGERWACTGPLLGPRRTPTARCNCPVAGSACINTGGEKVYPEEVKHVIAARTGRCGLPGDRHAGRERFGQKVVVLVAQHAAAPAGSQRS